MTGVFKGPLFLNGPIGVALNVDRADVSVEGREVVGQRRMKIVIATNLDSVNAEMSTWLPTSDISIFNRACWTLAGPSPRLLPRS